MISFSFVCAIFVSSTFADTSTELSNITNHLAPVIEWQDGAQRESLNKSQVINRLDQLMIDLGEVQLVRNHPAKTSTDKNTYGVLQLRNGNKNLRIFYFCKKNGNTHQINRIKITKA